MPTVHARAVERAVEILGSVQSFSERVKVAPSDVELWMKADAIPPTDIFLMAVDIISEHEKASLAAAKGSPWTAEGKSN